MFIAGKNGVGPRWLYGLVIVLVMACQVLPTPPALTPTSARRITVTPEDVSADSDQPDGAVVTGTASQDGTGTPVVEPSDATPGGLPPFPASAQEGFAAVEMVDWGVVMTTTDDYTLPVSWDSAVNPRTVDGLTIDQREFLADNGFLVIHSQEKQFSDIRERVSMRFGQPYYLTTDAAYHAMHLAFDEMLKALEKEVLRPRMAAIVEATLNEVSSYKTLVEGTALEEDVRLAEAYLGVALKLFEPQAELFPALEGRIQAQLAQIRVGESGALTREYSALLPGFMDDYSAYMPVGHYVGDQELETYFQGMTWLGRMHFKLADSSSDFVPSRAPLVITMAMRRADTDYGVSAAQLWADVNEVVSFLVGPSDDNAPPEYAILMDQVYGSSVTLLGLADDTQWRVFQTLGQELPGPQINSTFLRSLEDIPGERGWRFMGQRFSLDAFIMQNLVFDRVSTLENKRELPSGLDVMGALGSDAAMQALDEAGETAYKNYPQQMAELQEAAEAQTEAQWQSTAYGAWMYAFLPQLDAKDGLFPPYMRTPAWAYKDLNTALGSWAELKHDTTLYVKKPEAAGGGGPPSSGPAPGYVEPNPAVFYRLAHLGNMVVEGLNQRGLGDGSSNEPISLKRLLVELIDLADRCQRIGDIAVKELNGEQLDQDDYALIQAPLGGAEARANMTRLLSPDWPYGLLNMPPVPVISPVAGGGEAVLQVGTGYVDRIYILIPFGGGGFQVTQGGVFSYYEFPQPRAEQLSDEIWQKVLGPSSPEMPDWARNFVLPGGTTIDVLAFRVGDVYKITSMGSKLNLRAEPTRASSVLRNLEAGDYVEFVDGPVEAGGFTWWKIRVDLYAETPVEGWVVEDPEWYQRAWGQ